MDLRELHMQICDVKGGNHGVCAKITLACVLLIPNSIVMMTCPEVFILKEAKYLFENIYIKNPARK